MKKFVLQLSAFILLACTARAETLLYTLRSGTGAPREKTVELTPGTLMIVSGSGTIDVQTGTAFLAALNGVTTTGTQTLTNKTLTAPVINGNAAINGVVSGSGPVQAETLKVGGLTTGNTSWIQLRKSRAKLADMGSPNLTNSRFTILSWGDSVSGVPAGPICDMLGNAYGWAGFALDELDPSGYSANTTVTDYTEWYVRYWLIDGTNANLQWPADSPGIPLYSDTFSVYYLKKSGGGTFKLQFQVDGGSWQDVTIANGASADLNSISASNASTISAVASFTLPANLYRIRAVRLTGTVGILGPKIMRTDRAGIVKASIFYGGNSLYDRNTTPSATYTPVLQDIAPDLAIFAMKEALTYSGTSLSQALDTHKTKMDTALPNAEWVYFSTNPLYTPQTESDGIAEQAIYRAWTAANNQSFFDGFTPFKDGATVNSVFGYNASDGVHLTAAGARYIGQLFVDALGLGSTARTASRTFAQTKGLFEIIPTYNPTNGTFGNVFRLRSRGNTSSNINSFQSAGLDGTVRWQLTETPSNDSLTPGGPVLSYGSASFRGYSNSGNAGWIMGRNDTSPASGYLTSWRPNHLMGTSRIYDGSMEIPAGGVATNFRAVTGDTSISSGAYDCDSFLVVTATSNITLTLPAANSGGTFNPLVRGRPYTVIRTDSGTNTVTVARSSSDTIDGATSITVPTGGWVTLVSNGTATYRAYGSNIPLVGKSVFVDSARGSDSTGLRERPDRPFATPDAANTAAVSGDTIYIRPGSYTYISPAKDGVNIDLANGATMSSHIYVNSAATLRITGNGVVTSGNGRSALTVSHTSANVTVNGITFVGASSLPPVSIEAGTASLQECRIVASGTAQTGVLLNSTIVKLRGCEIVSGTSGNSITGSGTAISLGSWANTAASGPTVSGTLNVGAFVQ